jgi:hypothetical protein
VVTEIVDVLKLEAGLPAEIPQRHFDFLKSPGITLNFVVIGDVAIAVPQPADFKLMQVAVVLSEGHLNDQMELAQAV